MTALKAIGYLAIGLILALFLVLLQLIAGSDE